MNKTMNKTMNKAIIAALATGALFVAGCSADKTDFKAAAEKGIRGSIEEQIEGDASVECDDPASTDVGTTFACVGTASDGSTSDWTAEITGEKEVSYSFGDTPVSDETVPATEGS